jgi:phthiocerol/phenolphthiocerol synthesis type-I polyketide synthase E
MGRPTKEPDAGEAPAIAIIGLACRLPGAADAGEFWTNLYAGVDSVVRASTASNGAGDSARVHAVGALARADCFDADYFRVPPSEALLMDPQQRVLLELATAALGDAGYDRDETAVTGVFVGSGVNHYFNRLVSPRLSLDGARQDERAMITNEKDFLASRIAFKLGLTGPSLTVQTGCSTSLTAIASACQALMAGDCDMALAGGVSLLMPDVNGYIYEEGGILSVDGYCRAFNHDASGTVPASGAGLVVLKRDADARICKDARRAVIRGWAVNNDGGSRAGFTAPSPRGQATVIRRAQQRAGVGPSDVQYIETHGTGTVLGDSVEIAALKDVFGSDQAAADSCAIASVKSNIGHVDAAAGVAGLIKAALAVENGVIPASLHFERPSDDAELDESPFYVPTGTVPWPTSTGRRVAGVSSFGIGGTNTHVVIENATAARSEPPERPTNVLIVSARTDAVLEEMLGRLRDWLQNRSSLKGAELADIAYTLAVGRPHFASRWAGAFRTSDEAIDALSGAGPGDGSTTRWTVNVEGSPEMFTARAVDRDDPLVQTELARLSGSQHGEPATAPEEAADGATAALSVLARLSALRTLGVTFARINASPWVAPAVEWFELGRPVEELSDVLSACTAADERSAHRSERHVLTVDPEFDLPAAVAHVWSTGGTIDWSRFFDGALRGRVPLPTYAFERTRFWLEPIRTHIERAPSTNHEHKATPGSDVANFVASVWGAVLGLDAVDHTAHFVDDLNGDSIFAVEIGARLSSRFGLDLPVDLPFIAPTVSESARHIEELQRLAPST